MSSNPLPLLLQRWRPLGKCLGLVLGTCLLATGCSLFQHPEHKSAQELLDKPITAERHAQLEEQAKPSWFQSLFGTPKPAKTPTMADWVGQQKPSM
jgi:hypothetical protein